MPSGAVTHRRLRPDWEVCTANSPGKAHGCPRTMLLPPTEMPHCVREQTGCAAPGRGGHLVLRGKEAGGESESGCPGVKEHHVRGGFLLGKGGGWVLGAVLGCGSSVCCTCAPKSGQIRLNTDVTISSLLFFCISDLSRGRRDI